MSRRIALALLVALIPTALHAQRADSELSLEGVVVDAFSGTALPNSIVEVGAKTVIANHDGRFRIEGLDDGPHVLIVRQLGYDTLRVEVQLNERTAPLTLSLEPNPVVLERITVMADRFKSARNRMGSSVRHFDRTRLLTSAAYDALEFVQTRSALMLVNCPSRTAMEGCAWVRGQAVPIIVYVDGARVIGGLAMLASYRPHELYSIDLIGGGRAIQAYTNWYVESVAEGRRLPPPAFFW